MARHGVSVLKAAPPDAAGIVSFPMAPATASTNQIVFPGPAISELAAENEESDHVENDSRTTPPVVTRTIRPGDETQRFPSDPEAML
jgi:hypothetical protein